MRGFSALALVAAFFTQSAFVGAVPTPEAEAAKLEARASSYWLANIQRQGRPAFGSSNFQVFRNVKDFGAKGDGSTDDTAAINNAISSGNRCGKGCDSSTTTPALVYFPPGTYVVSSPIVQYYYTQMVGDALTLPVIKAAPNFAGIAVIDSDPYEAGGVNWYTNQNNFFRQIRNFVIDLTAQPASTGTGIHWQVAQATSLQNIRFEMIKGANSRQQGIFMDNGSGGFMSDLTFNGGYYGAFLGSQQFTTRNLVFNDVQTAIFMNWNWLWTLKSVTINNCGVGINMANGGATQTVGSVILQDSKFSNTPTGVITAFRAGSQTNGTLVIDNVDFSGSSKAVADTNGGTILAGGSKVASWAQGHGYTSNGGNPSQIAMRGSLNATPKGASLLNGAGAIFERSKPQYENVPASNFISVKSRGAKGDGVSDDTAAIQSIFNSASSDQVVYFDHGAYLIKNTIKVPKNIKITGEIWPLIMADGPSFSDMNNPKPVFQVGQVGDAGAVEISDLIFETKGAAPGAILMEWNSAASSQGSNGIWDVHWRIGGSAGTGLQSNTCTKNPGAAHGANPACIGAFMQLRITKQASVYLENTWFWVSDHELDLGDHNQIDIYNGRGVLIESQGPVWLYGTASEHNQLYNYQLVNAKNVYLGAIQTETPYMQSNPNSLTPFAPNSAFSDPTFSTCTTNNCRKSWGVRIVSSSNILVYGAGLYSFFENYSQTCLDTESCQDNMVSVENCSGNVYLWGLSTKASTSMVTVDGRGAVPQSANRNNFCSTLAVFECP